MKLLLLLILITISSSESSEYSKRSEWIQIGDIDTPNILSGRRNMATWCYQDDMYVFGGKTDDSRVNDLWKWESKYNRWIWQPDTSVSPRSGSSFWNLGGYLWIYGGRNDTKSSYGLKDMWSYQPDSGTWDKHTETEHSPHIRYGSTVWTDEKRGLLYLYGGKTTDNIIIGDMWAFNIKKMTWSNIPLTGSDPGLRDDAMATVYKDQVYFFGGHDGTNREVPYLKILNLKTLVWSEAPVSHGIGPETREDQVMWIVNDILYLFGGKVGDKIFNDFWEYNINDKTWSEINTNNIPLGRWGSGYCVNGSGYLHMFGGAIRDSVSLVNDFWFFSPNDNIIEEVVNSVTESYNYSPLLLSGVIMLSLIFLILLTSVIGGTVYIIKRHRIVRTDDHKLDNRPDNRNNTGKNSDINLEEFEL